jgi:hypothetical protein
MTRYLPEPHRGLPSPASGKLARTLKHMDAQAVALERADELRIGRSVEATRKGMAGIAQMAAERRAWARAFPEVEPLLNGAVETGAATILGRIIESGF